MDQKPFSARRAVENDFSLTPPMLFPFIAWLVYLMPMVLVGSVPFLLYLAVATTVAAPLLLFWRLSSIRRVFEQGQVVAGVVRNVQFIKDRGRINYTYEYAGQEYTGTVPVHVSKRSKSFQAGQPVKVVVNPEKPRQSYLRGLYT